MLHFTTAFVYISYKLQHILSQSNIITYKTITCGVNNVKLALLTLLQKIVDDSVYFVNFVLVLKILFCIIWS
jgi:hypothetical protein